MKKYVLEPDLVTPGRYYIQEYSEDKFRTAIIIYSDYDLAKRILEYLQEDQREAEGETARQQLT